MVAVDSSAHTRRRILVLAAGAAIPALAYSMTGGKTTRSRQASTPNSAPAASIGLPQLAASATTTTVAVTTASIPNEFVALDHDIGVGSTSNSVARLQDRLRALGFDPGPTDSVFGPATERAVWAYEKLVINAALTDASGVVTSDIWNAMNQVHEFQPLRSGRGTHLEVLLNRQVAILYVDGSVRLITHISTGTGDEWCAVVTVDREDGTQMEDGICGVAVTPGGVFHFERRVTGWRNSKLGRLYNPVYFNYGLAVHGASSVPKAPASHGCVRIPMHIAEYFPGLVSDGDVVYVFDGVKEPEFYGAQVPTFDYPDPDYVDETTTTSTSRAPSPPTTTASHVDATSTTVSGHDHPDAPTTSSPAPPTSVNRDPSTSTTHPATTSPATTSVTEAAAVGG